MAAANVLEEITAPFKESLSFLATNNKYEIVNLTQIAKDSVEYAQPLAKILEEHIKTTQPTKKLPALYLLDSIAKNIGSPYTVYFSRNLYTTFLEAYRMVDVNTRNAMEAMLKTWREPIPNSTDLKPVFNVEVVKSIQSALIRARNAAQQGQIQQFHALPARPPTSGGQQWQGTATPPQFDPRFAHPPSVNGYAQPGQFGGGFPTQHQQPPQGFLIPQMSSVYPQQQQPQNFYSQTPFPDPSQDQTLFNDLEALVLNARDEFARSPYSQHVQQKLKALLDLERIVKTQALPPEQKHAVVAQVNALKQSEQQRPQPAPYVPPTPQQQYQQLAPPPTTRTLSPALGSQSTSTPSLADLLRQTAPQRTSTPPTPHLAPPPNIASIADALGSAPAAATNAAKADDVLLASLRAAGLLPPETPRPPRPGSTSQSMLPFAAPVNHSMGRTSMVGDSTAVPHAAAKGFHEVALTSASLRIPRPGLLRSLYTSLPSQCATCGRRFEPTPDGKSRKARHLDFHFRTNQRITDTSKRGMTRNWYINEIEWIKFKEIDDGDEAPSMSADFDKADGSSTVNKGTIKTRYIKAPSGPLASQPCSICQEKFETVWNDEAQDWVWMDAVQVGNKVYHATCYEEATKNAIPRSKSPGVTVLGKRKSEFDNGGSKLKREMIV